MGRTGGRRVIKGWPHNSTVRDLRWLHHTGVGSALTGTKINSEVQKHIDCESAMYSLQFSTGLASFPLFQPKSTGQLPSDLFRA